MKKKCSELAGGGTSRLNSDFLSTSLLSVGGWVGTVARFPAKVALANCLHYVKWMVILIAVITVFLMENDSQP